MEIYEFVNYLSFLIPISLFALLFYSFYFAPYSIYKYTILGYLSTCLVFAILGWFMGEFYGNNLILIPVFGVLELGWFSWIYFSLTGRKICFLIPIPTLICLIYELMTVDFNNVENLQSYTRFLSTLSLNILALFYCYLLLKNNWKRFSSPFFLLNASVLVYASFNCFYYLPINLLINWGSQMKFWFWLINIIVTLIFYFVNTRILCTLGKMKTP